MNKISDIISTPVISIYEGEYIGIVYNIMFDCKQKRVNYACILDEQDNIPRLIKIKDLYKIGSNCIFIKNKSVLNLKSNCEKELENNSNPINLKVYNIDCNYIGTSHDIVIDDNFLIKEIILNNGKSVQSSEIFNIGKSTIIVGKPKISIQKFKPTTPKNLTVKTQENKVMILSDFIKKEETKSNTNNKIITDFRFLIGRILNQDIKAINGEVIAKKNSIVTSEIVNKASYFGKLVEIARYSK